MSITSREYLQANCADFIWLADTFVDFEAGLNTTIKRLRETLGDSAENPAFIETVPKRGYRFIAPVSTPGAGLKLVADKPNPARGIRRNTFLQFGGAQNAESVIIFWR